MSEFDPIVIDLDADVANSDGTFEIIPEGWYDVIIDDVTVKEAKSEKNAGKPMYNYKFKVEGGDYNGRILFTIACLWKEAIFTQKAIQTAVGTWSKGETKFNVTAPDDLIGKTLKVKVAVGEYQGEEKNEVKRFIASDESTARKPAAKKKSGFSL